MAGLAQLESFIGKFRSLWFAGFDASLEVKAHAGEARVYLQVGLGQAHPPQPRQYRVPGPSRLRRRQRREEARKQVAVQAKKIEAAAQAAAQEAAQAVQALAENAAQALADKAAQALADNKRIISDIKTAVQIVQIESVAETALVDKAVQEIHNIVAAKATKKMENAEKVEVATMVIQEEGDTTRVIQEEDDTIDKVKKMVGKALKMKEGFKQEGMVGKALKMKEGKKDEGEDVTMVLKEKVATIVIHEEGDTKMVNDEGNNDEEDDMEGVKEVMKNKRGRSGTGDGNEEGRAKQIRMKKQKEDDGMNEEVCQVNEEVCQVVSVAQAKTIKVAAEATSADNDVQGIPNRVEAEDTEKNERIERWRSLSRMRGWSSWREEEDGKTIIRDLIEDQREAEEEEGAGADGAKLKCKLLYSPEEAREAMRWNIGRKEELKKKEAKEAEKKAKEKEKEELEARRKETQDLGGRVVLGGRVGVKQRQRW
eukprot:GFUD01022963.1.p1 GENE.GFUD01022963.1~~GFUD01022963.1.p1  ORF type:complete len:517 (+),score=172.08 GFUD01022963.1:107-1552(+)